MAEIKFEVAGTIPVMAQPTNMSCWATVTTMMMSWKQNQSLTIEAAMQALGSDFLDIFKQGQSNDKKGGLYPNRMQDLATSAGMAIEYQKCETPDSILKMLQNNGPISIIDNEQPDDSVPHFIHARIIHGIYGDGTGAGTFLEIIDPAGGQAYDESFDTFASKYESMSAANGWQLQMMHYTAAAAGTDTTSGATGSNTSDAGNNNTPTDTKNDNTSDAGDTNESADGTGDEAAGHAGNGTEAGTESVDQSSYGNLIIDVSSNQGTIDWVKVANSGVQRVIVRLSLGYNTVDKAAATNAIAAAAAGIRVSYYHFAYPDQKSGDKTIEGDAKAEANYFTGLITQNNYPKPEVLAVDLEYWSEKTTPPTDSPLKNPSDYSTWLTTFLSEVKNAFPDTSVMIYGNADYLNKHLPSDHAFGNYPLWLAAYVKTPKIPNGWTSYDLWQYTDKGIIDGIKTAVDLSTINNKTLFPEILASEMQSTTPASNP